MRRAVNVPNVRKLNKKKHDIKNDIKLCLLKRNFNQIPNNDLKKLACLYNNHDNSFRVPNVINITVTQKKKFGKSFGTILLD